MRNWMRVRCKICCFCILLKFLRYSHCSYFISAMEGCCTRARSPGAKCLVIKKNLFSILIEFPKFIALSQTKLNLVTINNISHCGIMVNEWIMYYLTTWRQLKNYLVRNSFVSRVTDENKEFLPGRESDRKKNMLHINLYSEKFFFLLLYYWIHNARVTHSRVLLNDDVLRAYRKGTRGIYYEDK